MAKKDNPFADREKQPEEQRPDQERKPEGEQRIGQDFLARMQQNMAQQQPMTGMGMPGQMPMGAPGQMPMGAPGQMPMGMGGRPQLPGAMGMNDPATRGQDAALGDGTGSMMSKERLQKAHEALNKYKAGKKSV